MKKDFSAIIIAVVAVLMIGGGIIYATTRGGSDEKSSETASSSSESSESSDIPPMSEAKEVTDVEIKNFTFGPEAIKVKVGTKVTWTNQDTVKHNAAKDEGQADGPDGPLLAKGESYSYTFNKAGTFTYHCDPHLSMKAVVYVTE